MSTTSRIRHSFVGKAARRIIHYVYHLQHPAGQPVTYRLPAGVSIDLYPEGEIAEFLAVQRLFEKTELALVGAYLKPGMKVVDVGANIGLYSIFCEKLAGQTGTVWAFEPSGESFGRLRKNLALNRCERVRPIQIALSDKSDVFLTLKSDPGFGDAYRYLATSPEASTKNGGDIESVEVTTLDAWAAKNGLIELDFLKVDVEGGEYGVFRGAREIIRASRNLAILFESDPGWCDRAGCSQQDTFGLLKSIGLGLYGWNGKSKQWMTDDRSLLESDMVWACFDRSRLPVL
ncbi:MAG: FkbM family methyltransferase [Bryobacteraceae bacterium]